MRTLMAGGYRPDVLYAKSESISMRDGTPVGRDRPGIQSKCRPVPLGNADTLFSPDNEYVSLVVKAWYQPRANLTGRCSRD